MIIPVTDHFEAAKQGDSRKRVFGAEEANDIQEKIFETDSHVRRDPSCVMD